MSTFKLIAAAAVVSTLVAGPALARDGRGHYHGGFGPGAVAAGIAGAAIGGAIASAPYRDSYAYYGDGGDAPGYVYDEAPGYEYGYSSGSRTGNSWNSRAGAGGYNTDATRYDYNW